VLAIAPGFRRSINLHPLFAARHDPILLHTGLCVE
jgi:hypothetical protein